MSDPYVGEIKMFAGNFAPRNYALCNGQILPIAQNTALFSILGVNYGGNGTSNFALPNLQGNVPMGQGNGPGLTPRTLGEQAGEPNVTVLNSEMAAHIHSLQGTDAQADLSNPTDATFGAGARGFGTFYAAQGNPVTMAPQAIGLTGGSQPHNNMQPYLGLNFIIALQGIFPPRS